jgi:SAM-dependent methyltransferase
MTTARPRGASAHAKRVSGYYDQATPGFYLEGWDPDHLHLGLFDGRRTSSYRRNPRLAVSDRGAAIRRMTRSIVEASRISKTDLVVDAGCGVGGTSLDVVERYGCRVVGLNINQLQLDIARRRATERGLAKHATFRLCDCSRELPFPDGSVDVILNIESACHYRDRARFISECARVLRPRGRLILTDWMSAENLSVAERGQFLAPFEAAWFLWRLDPSSTYKRMLEASGMRIKAVGTMGRGILPNGYFMQLWYHGLLFASIQRPLTSLEQTNMERFRSFSEALLGGYFSVGRFVAVKPRPRT